MTDHHDEPEEGPAIDEYDDLVSRLIDDGERL